MQILTHVMTMLLVQFVYIKTVAQNQPTSIVLNYHFDLGFQAYLWGKLGNAFMAVSHQIPSTGSLHVQKWVEYVPESFLPLAIPIIGIDT